MTEREAIRRRREAGAPKPWTTDHILREYRFCNVERERDRVTMHIAKTWRTPHADDPQLWFAMAAARFINRTDTIDELGYPVPFDRVHFTRTLTARVQRGEQIVGPAYKIVGSRCGTIQHIDGVLNRLWRSREHLSPTPGLTLAAYCDRLMQFDGVKGFMAGQIIADLKYVEPLRSASDWMTFAVSGPGSRRGLNRVLGRPVDSPWNEVSWQTAFHRFEDSIRPELRRIGLGALHAQDLQNCLCEVDKFLRAKLGEGRPKRRFAVTA